MPVYYSRKSRGILGSAFMNGDTTERRPYLLLTRRCPKNGKGLCAGAQKLQTPGNIYARDLTSNVGDLMRSGLSAPINITTFTTKTKDEEDGYVENENWLNQEYTWNTILNTSVGGVADPSSYTEDDITSRNVFIPANMVKLVYSVMDRVTETGKVVEDPEIGNWDVQVGDGRKFKFVNPNGRYDTTNSIINNNNKGTLFYNEPVQGYERYYYIYTSFFIHKEELRNLIGYSVYESTQDNKRLGQYIDTLMTGWVFRNLNQSYTFDDFTNGGVDSLNIPKFFENNFKFLPAQIEYLNIDEKIDLNPYVNSTGEAVWEGSVTLDGGGNIEQPGVFFNTKFIKENYVKIDYILEV